MTRAVDRALAVAGEHQPLPGVVVLAQRTAQGHQAVAGQALGQQAALGSQRGGNGEAGHAFRQRQRLAVVGVSDLIVVTLGDDVLVIPKDRAQEVKAIVEYLAANPPPTA